MDTLNSRPAVRHDEICTIWIAPADGCSCGAWLTGVGPLRETR
ncbi:hypothetical protein [Gordonia alkaliphila]